MPKKISSPGKSVLAISTLLALSLSACGGSGDASEGTSGGDQTLTVMHKWPEGDHAAFFEKVVDEFEKANPGVTVDMQAIQDDPYKERLRVLTASNDLPDVYFAWPGGYGEQYFDAGFAADLSSEMDGEWEESLMPAAVEAYTVEGKNYAVPVSMSGKYMIYNSAMFDEHGVQVPTTYEELLRACDTFKGAGLTPITMGNNAMWPGVHYLTTLIAKHVPHDVMQADFDPATATFDHPGYIRALEDLNELAERCFTDGSNGISNDSAKAEIQTGVAPMYYGESNIFSIFREANGATPDVAANWNFFAFPDIEGAEGDAESLTGAPDGFIVNEKSDNKDLAIEFLKFFTTQENGARLLEMRDRPSAVVGSAEGVADVLPQLEEALTHLEGVETFNIWLDTATEPEVGAAFLAGGQAAINGSQTPEQILDSIRAASNSLK